MIEFTKAYKTTDGATFASIPEAQAHELELLIGDVQSGDGETVVTKTIKLLIASTDKVVDILTTTATSKPRARKANGGTKKRKPAQPSAASIPTAA